MCWLVTTVNVIFHLIKIILMAVWVTKTGEISE